MANRTPVDEGMIVIGQILLITFFIITSPLWGPVWLLGALKIRLFGPSEAPYRTYIPEAW